VKRCRPTTQPKPRANAELKNEPTCRHRIVPEKKQEQLNDRVAAQPVIVEDPEWISFKEALSNLKEALGTDETDDEDFCKGILRQLESLASFGSWGDRTDFYFVLSVLKDAKPVNKLHAMLVVQMAVCNLAVMRQAQILLKPVRFELPADLQLALHHAKWDTSRLDKQKIKIDDLPVRLAGERAVTRLMQTYALQLQTSAAYQKCAETSVKAQHVSAITNGQGLLTSSTEPGSYKRQKTAAGPSSRGLNGSQQPAASISGSLKEQMNAIDVQKSRGRASS
jgi:hypothetical protein